jgi:hypothetical protein
LPPIPIPAIFSLSLGATCPSPETAKLGITVNPATAVVVAPINLRRDTFKVDLVFIFNLILMIYRKLNVLNSDGFKKVICELFQNQKKDMITALIYSHYLKHSGGKIVISVIKTNLSNHSDSLNLF